MQLYLHGAQNRHTPQHFSIMENKNKKHLRTETVMIFLHPVLFLYMMQTYIYAHGTRRISQHFSTMENENKKCLRAQTFMILSSSSVVTSCEQKVPEGINLHDLAFIQCYDIIRTKSAGGHKPPWSCLHPVLWHCENKKCLRAQAFKILSSSSAVSIHDADIYR